MREALGTLAPTTVMTGNLTQFVMDLVQQVIEQRQPQNEPSPKLDELKRRIDKFGSALLGFVIGAATGALAMHLIGFWAIALPAITIAVLAIDLRRRVPVEYRTLV